MTVHALRDYQTDGKLGVYHHWHTGKRVVLLVLPTGAGKTVVFANVLGEFTGAACAVAHRAELVVQMSVALAREGVRHRVIGPAKLQRACSSAHLDRLGRDYIDPNGRVAVASVDTLVGMDPKTPWLHQVGLWIMDEAHHVLVDNKWGNACKLFPNAYGLGVTATPTRADGKGLGAHADGLAEAMIVGPSMRELIERGFLTEYRVFAPPSDIDLSSVPVTDSGDFSPVKLRGARRRSHITGDVVQHYLRIAPGKLGVTFDTDIESATETAQAYRDAGVPAEVVTSKTPDALRAMVLRRFERREILQLVNVDLFGEGFDLPAIEVVSMARPTQSYSLYCLDPETEVLTPDGWKGCDAALAATHVVAFDAATGQTRAVPVEGRTCRPLLPGESMFRLSAPHLDLCVSDQHRLLVKGAGKTCVNWQFETAEKTAQRRGMFRVPVAGEGAFPGSGLSSAELEFLGWFLSDGNLNPTTGGVTISQSAAKINHLASIRYCLTACGFKFTETRRKRSAVPATHNNIVLFTISRGAPRSTRKHLSGWGRLAQWVDKSLPRCYDDLTRADLLVLLGALNLGDGDNQHVKDGWTKRSMTIACGVNYRLADRLQALCVQRGLRCNKAVVQYEGRQPWAYLHIKDKRTSSVAGTGVRNGVVGGRKPYLRSRLKPHVSPVPFVWCLTNSLGTLITRRNGKVAIVGNCQQFGRALRPLAGKTHAIIIDHVGNVLRHGLPDARREWTLDRRDRRSRSAPTDVIPVRTCTNVECVSVYERVLCACPYCGTVPPIVARSSPEQVDGDLAELDPTVLAALRGERDRIDRPVAFPPGLPPGAYGNLIKTHEERQVAQQGLREVLALWGGWNHSLGRSQAEGHRRFFHQFGVDVMTAQTLNAEKARGLEARIRSDLEKHNVVEAR